jgi:uncharacterized membrane protein
MRKIGFDFLFFFLGEGYVLSVARTVMTILFFIIPLIKIYICCYYFFYVEEIAYVSEEGKKLVKLRERLINEEMQRLQGQYDQLDSPM